MTVQNVNGKKINNIKHTNPVAPQQRTDRLAEFFAQGGSIFDAAKGFGGNASPASAMTDAKSADAQATTDTQGFDEAAKQSEKSVKEIQAGLRVAQATSKSISLKVKEEGHKFNLFIQKSKIADKEIKALTAERDAAQVEADAASSSNNAPNGTSNGASNPFAVYSLNMPGGAQQPSDSKNGSSLITGSNNTQNTENTENTKSAENTDNTEKQEKVDELNSKIAPKLKEKTQAESSEQKALKQAKAAFGIGKLKLDKESDKISKDKDKAADDITKAQQGQQTASTVTQVGGATTATGQALLATPEPTGATKALGATLVKTGTCATIAGTGLNVASTSSLNEAQGKSKEADKANAELAKQRKMLAANYTQAVKKSKVS